MHTFHLVSVYLQSISITKVCATRIHIALHAYTLCKLSFALLYAGIVFILFSCIVFMQNSTMAYRFNDDDDDIQRRCVYSQQTDNMHLRAPMEIIPCPTPPCKSLPIPAPDLCRFRTDYPLCRCLLRHWSSSGSQRSWKYQAGIPTNFEEDRSVALHFTKAGVLSIDIFHLNLCTDKRTFTMAPEEQYYMSTFNKVVTFPLYPSLKVQRSEDRKSSQR